MVYATENGFCLQVAKINIYLKLVAICSSCINPIFYGWLNRAFRKEASQLMETCKWPRCVQNILKTVGI